MALKRQAWLLGIRLPVRLEIEKREQMLRNERLRVTRERDTILGSSSWRVTSPLRRFAGYVRRIRPTQRVSTSPADKQKNAHAGSQGFTAHNVRLDDGRLTKPDADALLADSPWFISVKRLLETIYPDGLKGKRIADLGCLEGGYTVEFARMGMEALGLEVRPNNFANCLYVKEHTSLPNLQFVNDDAWNIKNYGTFDIVFCCGLLYHLDRPVAFLRMLSDLCRKGLILNTHFATAQASSIYALGELTEHEGVAGRWFFEYDPALGLQSVTELKWASWSNPKSFWIRREHLLGLLRDTGFQLVFEQFDFLEGPLAPAMLEGVYAKHQRGVFVGLKCG
jgi:2-polyprenyl-3-methyl-5-hydroxy-6-metoxy-1,4-benzoquinol methylase